MSPIGAAVNALPGALSLSTDIMTAPARAASQIGQPSESKGVGATLGEILSGIFSDKKSDQPPVLSKQDVETRQSEIAELRQLIKENSATMKANSEKIANLGMTKTPSPKGTQASGQQALKDDNARLTEDNRGYGERLKTLQGEVEGALKAKASREQSWQEAYPGPFATAAVASPIGSYFLGKLPGKKLASLPKAITAGSLAGAGEGFAAAYAPTYLDLKLPGGEAKEAAEKKVADPLFWLTQIAPVVATNALFGGLGAYRKNLSMRPNIGQQSFPQSPAPPTGSPNLPMPQSPAAPPIAAPTAPAQQPSLSPLETLIQQSQGRPAPRIVHETPHGLRDLRTGRYTSQ